MANELHVRYCNVGHRVPTPVAPQKALNPCSEQLTEELISHDWIDENAR